MTRLSKLIKENSDWLAKQNDKRYSLQLDKYRKEQKAIRSTFAQNETLIRLKDDLSVSALTNEENKWANDQNKQERFNLWLKSLRKDIYLDQAGEVVNDIINQQNIVKSKLAEEPVKKAF
ncbi:MAG: carboxy terminal-processing peptidase [Bacteroidota bacterium]